MENISANKAAILILLAAAISAGPAAASAQPDRDNTGKTGQVSSPPAATPCSRQGDSLTTGKRYAVTTLSANYLREKPDFTAELGNQLLMGTPVVITGEKSYWRQVLSPDPYTAWCVDLGLREMSAEEISAYIAEEKVICTADYSKVLARPSGKAMKICDIVSGDLLRIRRKTPGKYLEVLLPSGETGYVRKKDTETFRTWAFSREASAANIMDTAMDFLGVPYLWGGTSIKGVDCSGFTRMVWFLNGVLLPRNASQQAAIGEPVEIAPDTEKFPVDSSGKYLDDPLFRQEMTRRTTNLRKGDLIFFGTPAPDNQGPGQTGMAGKDRITHVGIYIGNGKFIHASKYVRINSLIPGEPDFHEISGRLIQARRIIGQEGTPGITRITGSPAYFPCGNIK